MAHSLDHELVDHAVRLLGTAIGMIMEDHVEDALTVLTTPKSVEGTTLRLGNVGRDVALLADAMNVLLSRKRSHGARNVGRPASP